MNTKQLRWYSLKVGIVVLIGLIVFIFIVSIVGTEQDVFAKKYTLMLFMPNVQGLVPGAQVTLGGLKVGYVTDLQFGTRDGRNGVNVTMEIITQYHSSITDSSMAQIKTIGLLGDKYIDISIGSQAETPLVEHAYLPLRESFDLEMAGPTLKSALADFTEVMKNAKRITGAIDRGQGSVGKLITQPTLANELERFVKSLNGVMTAIEAKRGALGTVVYDEKLANNISGISSNLRTVTDQIRQGKGTMGKLVMDDRLYINLSSFTARADSLMARAANDSSNVSKIISDREFYPQILGLMRDLNLLLIDLREHPERYVKFSVF